MTIHMHQVVSRQPGAMGQQIAQARLLGRSERPSVATRSIRVSPSPLEKDALYFAGYDANKVPAHDTAWIFRSTIAAAIETAR
jgi:hypothetical protein